MYHTAMRAERVQCEWEDLVRHLNGTFNTVAEYQALVQQLLVVARQRVIASTEQVTYTRIAHDHGFGLAAKIRAPTATYAALSEEQQQIIKEHLKEEEKLKKEQLKEKKEAEKSTRSQPYPAGNTLAERKNQGHCHVCGQSGHWFRDGKCKPADIQAKAMKDAGIKGF